MRNDNQKNFSNVRKFVSKFVIGSVLVFIKKPNCEMDKRTVFCLYVPGLQGQVFKPVPKVNGFCLEKFRGFRLQLTVT